MKKRILSLLLALTLCMGLSVPALAAPDYHYKELTFTDDYGSTFTFDKAAYFYGIVLSWCEDVARERKEVFPIVVLKDNSRVTVSGQSSQDDREGYANLQGWFIRDGYYEYVVNQSFTSGSINDIIRADEGANAFCTYISNGNTQSMVFFVTEQVASEMEIISLTDEPTTEPITFQFGDNYYDSDIGPINDITFTNNTDERITGAFTLLIYNPEAFCNECFYECGEAHRDIIGAFLYPVDIDLAPGESMTETAFFGSKYNMTELKYVWVEYDDAAEREQYLNKAGSTPDATVEYGERYGYLAYWHLDAGYLTQYPYNITFAPVNHK